MLQSQEYLRLLTAAEEIELARRVHGDDPDDAIAARDLLVLHNLRLVRKIVGHMAYHWRHLEYDDLLSEALVALVQVAERYDPDTHHTRFSSYAVPDIKGRLRNFASQNEYRRGWSWPEPYDQADPAPAPLERIISGEEFGIAIRGLGKLAPLKAYVIARRYGIGELEVSSLRDIARDLGYSYEYVRQVEVKAISQLRLKARI
jgi:RNA polymerase sigma factor (sigma-70 family)